MIISRRASQVVAASGLLQLCFAAGLSICGSIILGLFHNISCIGLWLGLPMMFPAIASLVVLVTRKRWASIVVADLSIIVLAIALYHIYVVNLESNFWEKYNKYSKTKDFRYHCNDRGDHCVCYDDKEYLNSGYRIPRCSQFSTGQNIFQTMMGFTIAGAIATILNIVAGIWASVATRTGKMIMRQTSRLSVDTCNVY